MIYLIGGAPRCGKTTLTKKLAHDLRIGWISVDTLEGIVRTYTPKAKQPKLFPKNVLRDKTGNSNDELYTRYTPQTIVKAYLDQGKASAPAIRAFVADAISEGHDFVIEGYQLSPRLVAELMHTYGREIRSCFLVKKDEEALAEGFLKNVSKRDWVTQKTKRPSTFPRIAKTLAYFGKTLEKEACRYGLPVYSTDKDFLKMIAWLSKEMGK